MLETKRLILRRWNENDAESLYEYANLHKKTDILAMTAKKVVNRMVMSPNFFVFCVRKAIKIVNFASAKHE